MNDDILINKENIKYKAKVQKDWRLPWTEFEVVLGQRNFLSLRALNIDSYARAEEFLKNTGFNINIAEQRKKFEQFYAEAIFFIRHVLMSYEERDTFKIPELFINLGNPVELLLIASDRSPRRRYKRLWACAIFKVFNAIVNLENNDKLKEMNIAREQIFGKIKNLLSEDENNKLYLNNNITNIKLYALDWKEEKLRTSILLKLLNKPESVADEVFDYLGIRFVVENEYDLPLLLKLLIESDIIIPHQVLAVRTRNNLLSINKGKSLLDVLSSLASASRVDADEFDKLCKKISWKFKPHEDMIKVKNLFSNKEYRSLQITVRHLIYAPNPYYGIIETLTKQIKHYRVSENNESFLSYSLSSKTSRYFPIEIQIMDAHSYDNAKFGHASHAQYKIAQLTAVRESIFSGLLFFTEDKRNNQEMI